MRTFLSLILPLVVAITSASAATFTVSNTSNAGPGSFHQAILDANATPGTDEIAFNIPGSGVRVIDVSAVMLPDITDGVVIDGYTQPGTAPNTLSIGDNAVILIQLFGSGPSGNAASGLHIKSEGACTVRGLSFGGFQNSFSGNVFRSSFAIVLERSGSHPVGDGHIIEGNFIGLAPDGQTQTSNSTGVWVRSPDNRIGGSAPASRNVISNNTTGLRIDTYARNVVQGNYIGTDRTGMQGMANSTAVSIDGADSTSIGGSGAGEGNVIFSYGDSIRLAGTGAVIQGNLIGTRADGSLLPGSGSFVGVRVDGGFNSTIGGLEAGEGNRFGSGTGVWVMNGFGIQVLSNTYAYNTVPIFLATCASCGSPHNDLGDPDAGPNNHQNFPVITQVKRNAGSTTLIGGLNSTPSRTFTLQFYAVAASGQAAITKPFLRLLATRLVDTDGFGNARFDFDFPGDVASDEVVVATATDPAGNTSRFSPPQGYSRSVQLANISTRANIGQGDNVLIAGFVVHRPILADMPDFQKRTLIRALGPSLADNGISPGQQITDPSLEVYDSNGVLVAKNDNWRSDQANEIIATGAAPENDLEAAVVVNLPDGAFTAQVRGSHGETGIGIVEVYDLDPLDPLMSPGSGRLVNLSTRGQAAMGDASLIGGFIVNGDVGQPVIIRAIGPDLAALGLPAALPDPTLELRDPNGTLLASNDNWRDTDEQRIRDTGLAPNDDRDSAILTTLVPGYYTAVVRGKDNAVGLALVELYDLMK